MKHKILIINLNKRKDRKNKILKQLKENNIYNYDFIEAVDGSKINTDLIPLPLGFNRSHLDKIYHKHFNNNEIACIQSHIKALNYAKKHHLEYVIILEDDVILCEDWNDRLSKLFKLLPPKWNHVYLSGMPNEEEQIKTFRPLNLAPFLHIEQSIDTMGAFSYILKNDSYDLVINELNKLVLPVDDVIRNLVINKKLLSYTYYPFMTYHDNEIPSSIWDEKIWKQEYSHDHESKRFFINKL